MASYDHSQEGFLGGELTPRLWGHFSADIYKAAVASALNVQPTLHGSLLRRAGTRLVNALGGSLPHRLIQFRSSLGQDAVVVLGDREIRIFGEGLADVSPGGAVMLGSVEHVANGNFSWGEASWTKVGAANMLGGKAYCAQANWGQLGDLYLTNWVEGGWRQAVLIPGGGTYTLKFTVGCLTGPLRVKVGTTAGGVDLFDQTYSVDGPYIVSVVVPGDPAVAQTIYLEFFSGALWDGTMQSAPRAPPPIGIATVDSVSLASPGSTQAVVTTPWTLDMLPDIQVAAEPSGTGDRMFFVHGNAPPQVLTHTADGSWNFGAASFVNPPAEWTGTNWPSRCEIAGGRLWLAATPAARNAVWASRVARGLATDLLDFTDHSTVSGTDTVLPTDAISQRVASKGAIQWLAAQRHLLVGCDDSELALVSQGVALAPADGQAVPQSHFGSAPVQPVSAGGQALYVSADRRKVRAAGWEINSNSWESQEITFVAEHITAPGILELHFAREPIPTVLALLRDGTIAACTFSKLPQAQALWRIDVSDPIVSCAVSHGDKGATLWLAVLRPSGICLETLQLYESSDAPALDSSITFNTGATLPSLPGLAHLIGRNVQVLADGALLGEFTVGVAGVVLPANTATRYEVGLPFPARVVTLPPEGGNPRGTSQRARKRWVKLVLRLNRSALPRVNGDRAPDRSPSTPLDTVEPLFTGDVLMHPETDWDDRGQLTIEFDLPYRGELLALFGSLDVAEV